MTTPRVHRAGPLLETLITGVIICVTVVFNIKLVPLLVEGASSEGWPTVPGLVISSQLTSLNDDDGTKMFAAEVRYRYSVDGQAYEADRISSGWLASSLSFQAKARVRRYPEGREVRVHYNPARPSVAVLEPGIDAGPALIFGIVMAFNAVSLLMIVGLIPRLLRKPRRPLGELVRDDGEPYVRLTNKGDTFALTCWTALYAMGAVDFLLGVPALLFDWSGWIPLIGFAVVACSVPLIARHFHSTQKRHAHDLRVDFENGWVQLPVTTPPSSFYEPIPFSSLIGVSTASSADHPHCVDVLLEFKAPGEDHSQTTRLVLVENDEAPEVAARIKSQLETFIRGSNRAAAA